MTIFRPETGHEQIAHNRSVIAGVGCASAATSAEIIALVDASLASVDLAPHQLIAIASHLRRGGNIALMAAAHHYGVPLRLLGDDDLAADHASLCESVAAAAGTLCVGKQKSSYATCAIALCSQSFDVTAFGQAPVVSAATAPSTEVTSWAGP